MADYLLLETGDRLLLEDGDGVLLEGAGSGVTGTAAVTLAAATSTASGLLVFSGTAAPTLGAATSTASGTVSAPALASVQVPFTGTTIDTAIWTDIGLGVTQNDTLSVAARSDYGSYIATSDAYLADESSIFCEMVTLPATARFSNQLWWSVAAGSNRIGFRFDVSGGAWQLSMWSNAGVDTQIGTSIAFNTTTHKYLRIREASSTTYCDTSPDGSTWTNRWSTSTPAWLVAGPVGFQFAAGFWDGGDSSGTFVVDNINLTGAITGSAAVTLGAATSSATGLMVPSGTAAVTLGAATSTASGSLTFTGTAAVTLSAATSTASGLMVPSGTAAVTLGAATSSASGTFTSNDVTGSAAVTLGAATSTATGLMVPKGTAAVTLGAATSTASGTFTSAQTFTGTVAVSLINAHPTASGTFTPRFTGTVAVTLQDARSTASGTRTQHFFEPAATEVRVQLAASELRAQGLHPRWAGRFGSNQAFTVLKIDGSYVTLTVPPTTAQLAAATEIYLGGHRYPINGSTAAALSSAGYGAYVTTAAE